MVRVMSGWGMRLMPARTKVPVAFNAVRAELMPDSDAEASTAMSAPPEVAFLIFEPIFGSLPSTISSASWSFSAIAALV
jgi:hypothetical protein